MMDNKKLFVILKTKIEELKKKLASNKTSVLLDLVEIKVNMFMFYIFPKIF